MKVWGVSIDSDYVTNVFLSVAHTSIGRSQGGGLQYQDCYSTWLVYPNIGIAIDHGRWSSSQQLVLIFLVIKDQTWGWEMYSKSGLKKIRVAHAWSLALYYVSFYACSNRSSELHRAVQKPLTLPMIYYTFSTFESLPSFKWVGSRHICSTQGAMYYVAVWNGTVFLFYRSQRHTTKMESPLNRSHSPHIIQLRSTGPSCFE